MSQPSQLPGQAGGLAVSGSEFVFRRIAALADGDQILSSLHTAAGSKFPASEPRTVTLRGTSDPVEIVTIEWS